MTEDEVQSGRYLVNRRKAYVTRYTCGRGDPSVRVNYDDGCYTAAFVSTFVKWDVEKIKDSDTPRLKRP